jgi:hypothetical protein
VVAPVKGGDGRGVCNGKTVEETTLAHLEVPPDDDKYNWEEGKNDGSPIDTAVVEADDGM